MLESIADKLFDMRVGKASGLFGFVALVICISIVGYFSYLDRNPATSETCRKALNQNGPPKVDVLDASGTLRIVDVWPASTTINRRICLAVAGVAPRANEERLKQTLADRQRDARTRREDYDRAVSEASAANKIAAEAKVQADAAEQSQAADAKDLRAKAVKARSEADAKDQLAADLQKKEKAAADELAGAEAAVSRGLPPIDLTLYLNGHRAGDLTFKARAVSDIQYVTYDLSIPTDATSTGGKFWRELLAGGTDFGVKELSVGVSRTTSDSPEAADKSIRIRIYYLPVVLVGVLAMVCLSLWFCALARHTTLLRDNGKTRLQVDVAFAARHNAALTAQRDAKTASDAAPGDAALKTAYDDASKQVAALAAAGDEPGGSYSLGRTQMALWLVLTVAGFIFIWLTLGQFLNVITAAVLVLLGINGATGLMAVQLTNPAAGTWSSRSFLSDLMYDADGPKLQRIQVVAWTLILAVIFIWNTVANFYFVAFDTNLLLLMGIANTMYVGFKHTENH
jgi:hypothetical protein